MLVLDVNTPIYFIEHFAAPDTLIRINRGVAKKHLAAAATAIAFLV
jgi:hypothetical protein